MSSEVKDKTIGAIIGSDLSNYLRQFTSMTDRQELGQRMGISGETLHAIVSRRRNVTDNTYPALVALVRIAIENCRKAEKQAHDAEGYMKNLIES